MVSRSYPRTRWSPQTFTAHAPSANTVRVLKSRQLTNKHVLSALLTSLVGKCTPDNPAASALTVDLGANLGEFTSHMRAMGCRVRAVEPQTPLVRFLRASLDVNGWDSDDSVELFEAAVGETPGTLLLKMLWVPGNVPNKWKKEVVAPIVPLYDIITSDVAFLKLDIDGPEVFVFRALLPLLKKGLRVSNIMAEITFGKWPIWFNVSHTEGYRLLDQYYDHGYKLYLTGAGLFPIYEKRVTSNLILLSPFQYFTAVYEIPRLHLENVLLMNNVSTKNIYFTQERLRY
eukprot:Opistho-2@38790